METGVHKTINFVADLVPLIESGEKTTTWRLWDDKNLSEGDTLALICRPNTTPFAMAIITSAVEKTMNEISDEDMEGHEEFDSKEDMYKTYSKYYGRPVGPETPVKIIHFRILR